MFNATYCQYSVFYLPITVKLLIIGFFPSSAKTKAIFISSWKEEKNVTIVLRRPTVCPALWKRMSFSEDERVLPKHERQNTINDAKRETKFEGELTQI